MYRREQDVPGKRRVGGLWIALIVLILLMLSCFAVFRFVHVYPDEWKTAEATCTSEGGKFRVCRLCGKIETVTESGKKEHFFGSWTTMTEPTAAQCGMRIHKCDLCGYSETESVDPTSSLPKIFLFGHGSFSETETIAMKGRFTSGNTEETFETRLGLDINTTRVDKRTYVISRVTGEETGVFRNYLGVSTDSYLLVGGMEDATVSRFRFSSALWKNAVLARPQIAPSVGVNGGTNAGVPVQLYINNEFYGIYVMSLPLNDAGMFGGTPAETGTRAVLYCYSNGDAAQFRAPANTLSYRVCYTYDGQTDWVYDSFNRMMEFVTTKKGSALTKELDTYLDVDGALDYLLAAYAFGGDHLCGHVVWVTDDGVRWRPTFTGAYGMFGISECALPNYQTADRYYAPGAQSQGLLWRALLAYYPKTLKSRYAQLRKTVFSDAEIGKTADEIFTGIDAEIYEADRKRFPNVNSTGPQDRDAIVSWLRQRLKTMDQLL